MESDQIIARLREHQAMLRARGVAHVALFGSRARGNNRPDSDTDIMVEFDPNSNVGIWGYIGLKDYITSLLDGPVDVVDREALKPRVSADVAADAIYAF